MQLTNLSNNKTVDISIYYSQISENIFKDTIFIDLMNNIIQEKYLYSYRFAIYTDLNLLQTNIFIPVFHTIYLGSSKHNVIISNDNDLWLLNTFTNNNYYILHNKNDEFNYDPYNITKIQNIKELINYEIQ